MKILAFLASLMLLAAPAVVSAQAAPTPPQQELKFKPFVVADMTKDYGQFVAAVDTPVLADGTRPVVEFMVLAKPIPTKAGNMYFMVVTDAVDCAAKKYRHVSVTYYGFGDQSSNPIALGEGEFPADQWIPSTGADNGVVTATCDAEYIAKYSAPTDVTALTLIMAYYQMLYDDAHKTVASE